MAQKHKVLFVLLATVLALSVAACGQRVPLKSPEGRVQDTTEY